MLNYVADYQYIKAEGVKLFTVILSKDRNGKFPVVIVRTPYVDRFESEEENIAIERLRIDISSADSEHYVRHTNQKGLYSEQTTAKVAHNTVYLQKSSLTLPIEK